MPAITVPTIYRSSDGGAPVLTGLAYSLLALLDALLVNGYGAKNPLGWTRSFNPIICSGAASGGANNKLIDITVNFTTAGVLAGHQVIKTTDGLNARVTSISTTTNANDTLNFTAAAPITPTFGAADAYTVDNNKRVYKQKAGTNQFYLRVCDDGTGATNYARARGWEVKANDLDVVDGTNTGPFPTDALNSGGLYVFKSDTATATARDWRCISNGKIFYLFFNRSGTWNAATGLVFGDYTTYHPGDIHNTIILSGATATATTFTFGQIANTAGRAKPRTYAATGGAIVFNLWPMTYTIWNAAYLCIGYIPYPDPVSGGLLLTPVLLGETNSVGPVGVLPGIWNHCHPSLNDLDTFSGMAGPLTGKTFEVWHCTAGAASNVIIETSNTWS
jgi:hypothetical protein